MGFEGLIKCRLGISDRFANLRYGHIGRLKQPTGAIHFCVVQLLAKAGAVVFLQNAVELTA